MCSEKHTTSKARVEVPLELITIVSGGEGFGRARNGKLYSFPATAVNIIACRYPSISSISPCTLVSSSSLHLCLLRSWLTQILLQVKRASCRQSSSWELLPDLCVPEASPPVGEGSFSDLFASWSAQDCQLGKLGKSVVVDGVRGNHWLLGVVL